MAPATPPTADLEPGEFLGGCRIVSLLGKGGMGAVYEARQLSLDRKVAIKVLRAAASSAQRASQSRLIREARLTAKLNHPNIVQIYDVGEDQGRGFMIMEFIEGVTFRDLLERQERFPIDRLLRVAVKVARGLAAAHKERIVHRDIKPENILLTSQGEVKIADFGAAALASIDGDAEAGVFGTPSYIAPEVVLGEPSDGRADIYALGLVLYRAAAGVHPFPIQDKGPIKDKRDLLRAQVEKVPEPLRKLRPTMARGLADLIDTLCSKKPHQRPSSEELAAILDRHPEWARESGPLPPAPPPPAEGPEAPTEPIEKAPKRSLLDTPLLKEKRASAEAAAEFPSRWRDARDAKVEKESIQSVLGGQAAAASAPGAAGGPAAAEAQRGPDPRARELCVQARFHLMRKNRKEAEARFREALELDPASPEALLGLARILTEASRAEEATALIQRAIEGGKVDLQRIAEFERFDALRACKAFRKLLTEHALGARPPSSTSRP